MTLTFADTTREAAVPQAVDADPVKALLGAGRDGLLAYHGFVSGGRYEVEIAGRRMELPAAEVGGTVERLRAIASLNAAGARVELVAVFDDGVYSLQVAGRSGTVDLPAGAVVDWCAGFAAAAVAKGQEHVGEDRSAVMTALFECPSMYDQCRMVILGLMHGGPVRVSTEDLVDRIGALPGVERPPAKKTVVDALGFGNHFAPELAERMILAFGLRWSVTAGPGTCERAEGGALTEPVPEMPGLSRLQRIMAAAGNGWLRYVDEPSPNKARWLKRYQMTLGSWGYVIDAGRVDAWLDGVAAYHGV